MSEPYIGEIRIFGFDYAPRSWAKCNGQIVDVSQNTALFSIIGNTYGGDGRTTFGLPDLQSRAAMHYQEVPGLSSHRLGEMGGSMGVELNETMIPSHSHTLRAVNSAKASEAVATGNLPGNPSKTGRREPPKNFNIYADTSISALMAPGMVGQTGQSAAHNNMQPFLTLNFCIALEGEYPSRN